MKNTIMMKRLAFAALGLMMLAACQKEDVIVCFPVPAGECGVNNPVEDLTFLSEIKEQLEEAGSSADITSYHYNEAFVFVVNNCNGCSDAATVAYDCDGNEVCRWGGISGENTCPDFDENAQLIRVLWENNL